MSGQKVTCLFRKFEPSNSVDLYTEYRVLFSKENWNLKVKAVPHGVQPYSTYFVGMYSMGSAIIP